MMTSIPQLRRAVVLLKSVMAEDECSSCLDRLGNGGMSSLV